MAYNLKKTLEKKERFVGGHRLCAGCGAGIIAVRGVLRALRRRTRRWWATPPAAWRSAPSSIPTPPRRTATSIRPLRTAAVAAGVEAPIRP